MGEVLEEERDTPLPPKGISLRFICSSLRLVHEPTTGSDSNHSRLLRLPLAPLDIKPLAGFHEATPSRTPRPRGVKW